MHGCVTRNTRGQGLAAATSIRMIRHIAPQTRMRNQNWAKDMESSRRFLLQAEIEYWHEMLRINRYSLNESRKQEMRDCLKAAMFALNAKPAQRYSTAA
jgi:hypothetical protein